VSAAQKLRVVSGESDAERMRALFGGDERAISPLPRPPARPGDKAEVKYDGKQPKTEHHPATVEHWQQHLDGEILLGVVPHLRDGTATWGALDIDDYGGIDHADLLQKIDAAKLPLLLCRTKSNGARAFVFLEEAQPVEQVRATLRGAARVLGLVLDADGGKTEVFPKKESNCVFMPYLGPQPSGTACFAPRSRVAGEVLVDGFLALAEEARLSSEAWRELRSRLERAAKKQNKSEHTEADFSKFAEQKLAEYVEELRAQTVDRNKKLFGRAKDMGRMIGARWIDREQVNDALRRAALDCGLPPDEIDGVLSRALDAGEKLPPPAIGDGTLTEDVVAIEFAERHRGRLLHDHHVGQWFRWTGTHWQIEQTQLAFSEARELARELSAGSKPAQRRAVAKASFAGAVERFARADRAFAVTSEHWDTDIMLLATPGGTVDLRDGTMRAARPEDWITKITAVAPAPTTECPRWLRFLDEACGGDQEVITFLRRLCGYALTGSVKEQLLTFVYGGGGNGKSVFVNTVVNAMGDYAVTSAMDTFTASKGDRHPTDLAMLRGARLVSAVETEDGRAWAEARIKALTGGDRIAARYMRQDFFSFTPTFTLVIVGNHAPSLRNVNDAMRRRFAIVPFVNRPQKPDRDLESKLRDEWPGILRWMIDGCVEWQREGLRMPAAVQAATDEYLAEQDLFSRWVEERCEDIPSGVGQKGTASRLLYEDWAKFSHGAGEEPGTQKQFAEMMRHRDWLPAKGTGGVRVYLGVRLRARAGGGGPYVLP
jgi:putative DNA primase/helicase